MKARILFAAGLLLAGLAGVTAAGAQSVAIEKPGCLPPEENGVIRATGTTSGPGQSFRLYFRWREHEDFYWVPMEAEPSGRFWAIPPKPERRNEQVEIYGAVVDPAGKILSQSMVRSVKVRDCQARLTPKEQGLAENLTIGETAASQYKKRVIGFLCPGVKIRIDPQGVKRADEECGPCGLAWLPPGLATAGSLLGVVVGDRTPREASPSRP